jgi:hypothetical protein
MSSYLLEDIEDNNYSLITLSMSASGIAHLTISEDMDRAIASFELSPDANGIANAKVIAQALLDWCEVVVER